MGLYGKEGKLENDSIPARKHSKCTGYLAATFMFHNNMLHMLKNQSVVALLSRCFYVGIIFLQNTLPSHEQHYCTKNIVVIQTRNYLCVLKISYQLKMALILSHTDRLPPKAVKTVIDVTRYPAGLQPVRQLYFTLPPYINRKNKTIIMSRLNTSLSNQEREEILSKWFDSVVGLLLRGINSVWR
jgi:hypothetical protein